jgi:hypothetical protein
MSKRVNPHRRLLAAQARVLADARLEQSRVNGVDDAKLQQGIVRSHLRPNQTTMTFRAPHWSDADNPGRKTRKLKPRFSVK